MRAFELSKIFDINLANFANKSPKEQKNRCGNSQIYYLVNNKLPILRAADKSVKAGLRVNSHAFWVLERV